MMASADGAPPREGALGRIGRMPAGVAVVGTFSVLSGLISIAALFMLARDPMMFDGLNTRPPGVGVWGLVALGLAQGVFGVGMFLARAWAWWSALAFEALLVALNVPFLLSGFGNVLSAAFAFLVGLYLLSRPVQRFFGVDVGWAP